jgi:hypothetical protein
MGVENFAKVSVEGKRSAKRARVLLAAKLETASGVVDARLRDLSRKGALVECTIVPEIGSEVVFVRAASRVPARIAWAASGRVGLEFFEMIDEHDLLVQLGKPSAPKATSYSRPGLSAGMTAAERKLARAWAVSVGLNLPDRER